LFLLLLVSLMASSCSSVSLDDLDKGEETEAYKILVQGVRQERFDKETGIVEAVIEAATGKVSRSGSMVLNGVEVELVDEEGEQILIRADRGTFDDSKEVGEIAGNVVVERGTMKLETEKVRWDEAEARASGETPITLTQGRTTIRARRFVVDTEERRLTLFEVYDSMIDLTEKTDD
jgi:LPS export ABC transporter protein LptC